MRYWQHDETGRICESEEQPSERWNEVFRVPEEQNTQPKTTVAIIGSHPRTREAFDFDRTDADIWLFNEAISNPDNRKWAKRADMIWQMHVPAIWRNPTNRNDPHHYEWLQKQDECTVMMQDEYPDVPRSMRYPLEDIRKMPGYDGAHFLTSSVPQAIAYAIWTERYSRIEVYGVAMETNTEYQFQREGVAFWIGFAKGRGIDLYFADPTFDAPLYGYEGKVSVEYERFVERIDELKAHLPTLQPKCQAAVLEVKKAVEQLTADGSKENQNTLEICVGNAVQLLSQFGMLNGAIQENEKYRHKADAMKNAADGEYVFSRQEFESAASALATEARKEEQRHISTGTELGLKANEIIRAPRDSKKRLRLANEFWSKFNGDYLKAIDKMNIYAGAANENRQYMAYLDKYIRAAGGRKSEAVLLESRRDAEMVSPA